MAHEFVSGPTASLFAHMCLGKHSFKAQQTTFMAGQGQLVIAKLPNSMQADCRQDLSLAGSSF